MVTLTLKLNFMFNINDTVALKEPTDSLKPKQLMTVIICDGVKTECEYDINGESKRFDFNAEDLVPISSGRARFVDEGEDG